MKWQDWTAERHLLLSRLGISTILTSDLVKTFDNKMSVSYGAKILFNLVTLFTYNIIRTEIIKSVVIAFDTEQSSLPTLE